MSTILEWLGSFRSVCTKRNNSDQFQNRYHNAQWKINWHGTSDCMVCMNLPFLLMEVVLTTSSPSLCRMSNNLDMGNTLFLKLWLQIISMPPGKGWTKTKGGRWVTQELSFSGTMLLKLLDTFNNASLFSCNCFTLSWRWLM